MAGLTRKRPRKVSDLEGEGSFHYFWSIMTKLDTGDAFLGAGERCVWTSCIIAGKVNPADAQLPYLLHSPLADTAFAY